MKYGWAYQKRVGQWVATSVWHSLHTDAVDAEVEHPELITTTRLRKYNATVCQLMDLDPRSAGRTRMAVQSHEP